MAPTPNAVAASVHAVGITLPQAPLPNPKQGIGVGPDLKSDGLPTKSQRCGLACGGLTGSPPSPANPLVKSITPQGCPLSMVAMVLISQPSIICPAPFFPGMA